MPDHHLRFVFFFAVVMLWLPLCVHAQEPVEQKKEDTLVYVYVDQRPTFPGDSLEAYLQHNIRYPEKEKKKKIQGSVWVHFVVEKDGSISNVAVFQAVSGGAGLSTEAIRVISTTPKWIPGKKNGEVVRTHMTQEVRFVLP